MKYGIYYAYWERQWGADYIKYVKKVKELGFDILEISCAGLAETPTHELLRLRDYAKELNITLTAGYGPQACENLASDNPEIIKNAMHFWQKTFDALKLLDIHFVGGGLYSYWPADYTNPINKEEDLQRSIANMKKLAELAKNYDITLGMESLNRHEGYLINTAKECVNYIKQVNMDNVKVMLDTYHMNMEEDSIVDAVLTAGKYLGHVHIGENNRKLPGQGHIIPWNDLATALKQIGYDGTIVMEPFVIHGGKVGQDIRIWRDLKDDCSEKTLDNEAAESLNYIREIFK